MIRVLFYIIYLFNIYLFIYFLVENYEDCAHVECEYCGPKLGVVSLNCRRSDHWNRFDILL